MVTALLKKYQKHKNYEWNVGEYGNIKTAGTQRGKRLYIF
jgi:hypothetical protein